jgi:hypothetical protein
MQKIMKQLLDYGFQFTDYGLLLTANLDCQLANYVPIDLAIWHVQWPTMFSVR